MSIHRSDNEEQIRINFTHVAAFETASFDATFVDEVADVADGPRTHYLSWHPSAAAAGYIYPNFSTRHLILNVEALVYQDFALNNHY